MNPEKISASAFLSAVLVMSSFAGLGIVGNAFATAGNNTTTTGGNATPPMPSGNMTGNMTTTATAAAANISGVIASIQLDDNGNHAWITAGHWKIESDAPLVSSDNSTEPQVSNFTATLYMVSNADGTAFHTHDIANFTQTSVQHQGPNATTVNGTFSVTLEEEPIGNVRGYIHITGDKIEFWVDPVATDNHFGPTTVTGIVLDPEKTGHMKGYSRDNATMTQGTNSTESWQ